MLEDGVIVTGTDTGVGKTHITAALLLALRECSLDALPMKPVQTGAENNRAPDLDFCLNAATLSCDAAQYDRLAPYRFPLPASPHLAAREAGVQIDPARILSAFRALRAAGHPLIVEGAGGLLVPLTESLLQIDLFLQLDLPFIVVARAGLGTLNHTLLTLEALRARRAHIAAVVLNASDADAGQIADDNFATLSALNPDILFHRTPHTPAPNPAALRAAGRALLAALRTRRAQ